MKDLNISCDSIKVIEENMGRKISDIPRSNIFMDMSPTARNIKERINNWDLIKIKSFCMAKENSIKMKRQPTLWETYLPMIPQTSVWSLKCIKISYDSTPGRKTTQLNNGQKTWTDTSPRRTCRGPRDIWKDRSSASLAIREMQIKTIMRHYLTPVQMAIVNKSGNKCWRGCGEKGTLVHCWWECRLVMPLRKHYGISSERYKWEYLLTQQFQCWDYILRTLKHQSYRRVLREFMLMRR